MAAAFSPVHMLMIMIVIVITVFFALVVGYYYNTKKWQELKISVKEDIQEISSGLGATYVSKSDFDVKQSKEAEKVRELEEDILEDHNKKVKLIEKHIGLAKDIKDRDIENINQDLDNLKNKDNQLEFAKSQIVNMKNSVNNIELNATILANKIESMPVFQNVNQLETLQEHVLKLTDTTQDNKSVISGILEDVHSNHMIINDQLKQEMRHMQEYTRTKDLNEFKTVMDVEFVKDLSELIPKNRLTRDYVSNDKMDLLEGNVKKNANTVKTMNMRKENLDKLVKEDDAKDTYRTLDMMNGYVKHNDTLSLVKKKKHASQHAILLNRIAALNKTLLISPDMYADRSKADKLYKEAELLSMAVSDVEARYRNIVKNFVSNSKFDSANAEVRGMEAMAKETLDNLNLTMAGLKKTIDQVPNKYVSKSDAKKTLTRIEDTDKITNFVNNAPDATMLSIIKNDSDQLYSKPSIFAKFQSILDAASAAFVNMGSKKEFMDLSKLYDKKYAAQLAYIKLHEHDPITQSGEVSFHLNGPYPTFNVGKFDDMVPFYQTSYWSDSYYKVVYPTPFHAAPTNVSAKCVSDPSILVTVAFYDQPTGFVMYTKAPFGGDALKKTQLFSWSATGPRISNYKPKAMMTQKGTVSYVLNGADPKNVVAEAAGGWQNGWNYLKSDFENHWPADVPMSYWGWSWYKVNFPIPFSGPPTSVYVKCTSLPQARVMTFTDGINYARFPRSFLIYTDVSGIIQGNQLSAKQTFEWVATGPK